MVESLVLQDTKRGIQLDTVPRVPPEKLSEEGTLPPSALNNDGIKRVL